MSNELRIAIVTGGNKGIGYETVRGLIKSKSFDKIYLTSRNTKLGHMAVEKLNAEESTTLCYHQLDVSSMDSINNFAVYIKEKYGGVQALVQNAGIAVAPNMDKTEYPLTNQVYDS